MSTESKNILQKLKYLNDSFPSREWNDFLKNYNVNFYTSRKDRLWYSISGKGFIIWISSFYPSKENNQIIWLSDIEVNKNSPHKAFEILEEFTQGAIVRFEKMSILL
ncbi:hypothetical protein [Psychroserpens luteus]|uniref:Uncharacterized protein n=1 Tax=Psychroserpens luteus TaxID=1434066 RepID=A0ABW5ZPS4_9FLAO|nr:hypothetical protein [Psychroserpens luteus]